MSSTMAMNEGTIGHHSLTSKKDRTAELRHARKMIDSLQARCRESHTTPEDLNDFTEILSSVVDVLQSLELQQDSADDAGTAATLPETVTASISTNDELGCMTRVDDSYEDEQPHYEEPRRDCKHKRRQMDQRHESFNDDTVVIDETDEFAALSGYEVGFYPPQDLDAASVQDSFDVSALSLTGFETPTTRRTKETSVSEESQCFYCQMHGDGKRCQGTRFCC